MDTNNFQQDAIIGFFGENRFLSNFFPCNIAFDNMVYPSVEHAYQAQKFPINNREQFIHLTAGKAKRLGKSGSIVLTDSQRISIMENFLRIKFSEQNIELREKLLKTGQSPIYEFNNWGDTFWGVISKGNSIVGKNNLGRLLMQIRRELFMYEY